jgi:MFS family permease
MSDDTRSPRPANDDPATTEAGGRSDPPSLGWTLFGFTLPFYMLNVIEMLERLAYYGVRAVVAVYIMQADEPGGLHFTGDQKGSIYAWWFIFQSVLPTFTGGFADRYGYKKTLFGAITLNVVGYVMMAYLRSYWGFFAAVMVLASGTALFKPALQGSLAQTISEKRSSIGWGIFYWMVNIGAAIAPLLMSAVRTTVGWRWVFLGSAIVMSLNYLMLLTYPNIESGAEQTESPWQVFVKTLRNIIEPRLVTWLLIMSCFWLMMYQVWDLHPNFITDWVDSSRVAATLGLPEIWTTQTARGTQVNQEVMINLNPALIIVLMIPVSWAVARIKTLQAMVIGMLVATCGVVVTGFTTSGWTFLSGLIFFSLGEMLTGPKKNEYLALIAPPGKKALYLGYVNIPVGIGGFFGSKLAGYLYGHYGEKAVLSQRYLLEHTGRGTGRTWDGDPESLTSLVGVSRPEAFAALQTELGLDAAGATRLLWDTYLPHYHVWIPMACIGILGVVSLVIFNLRARRWKDMNV